MTELNPEDVVNEHKRAEHVGGLSGLSFCDSEEHERTTYWPCEKHELAARLLSLRGYAEAMADAPSDIRFHANAVAVDLFALLEGRPSPLEKQAAQVVQLRGEGGHLHNWRSEQIIVWGKPMTGLRCFGCGQTVKP